MNKYHPNLTLERWSQMSLVEQLANVGSGVERAISRKNKYLYAFTYAAALNRQTEGRTLR